MTVRVTQAERENMLRLRVDQGLNNTQIAAAVGRTHFAVTHSIGLSGTTSPTAKWRRCQMCRKRFLSEWAGNRRCGLCLRIAQGMSASLEP